MLTQSSLPPHRPAAFQTTRGVSRPHAGAHTLLDQIDLMGAPMTFGRNAEIYGENEPADYVYKVVSGTVRTYKIFDDGRRQIGAFYFPGDLFGVEVGAEHQFSAEAIEKCVVLVVKRSTLIAL